MATDEDKVVIATLASAINQLALTGRLDNETANSISELKRSADDIEIDFSDLDLDFDEKDEPKGVAKKTNVPTKSRK